MSLIPYAGHPKGRIYRSPSSSTATWTDERVERLRKLWSEGYSAAQIAEDIGGVTRNSVIGKITRLGLTRTTQPKTQIKRQRRTLPHRPAPEVYARALAKPQPVASKTAQDLSKPKHVTLYQLTDHICKFPYGEMAPYTYCGNLAEQGLPYCEFHAGVCFNNSEPRRRIRAHY